MIGALANLRDRLQDQALGLRLQALPRERVRSPEVTAALARRFSSESSRANHSATRRTSNRRACLEF